MTDDELFDLDDVDFDSDDDPFADATPAKAAVRSLEEFEAEVDKKIKILMARKSDQKVRAEAAYWLGESGAPKAITALKTVYEKDKKNKKVQQAAAYALGQFKALDEAIIRDDDESVADALGRDENEGVVQLLEDIVLHDKRGQRRGGSTRTMLLIEFVLLLTLGGLVAANLGVFGDLSLPRSTNDAEANLTGSPGQRALEAALLRTDQIETDARAVQQRLNAVQSGEALKCDITFNSTEAYTLDPIVAVQLVNLKEGIDRYNTVQAEWMGTRQAFDQACQANGTISASDTGRSLVNIEDILSDVAELKTDLSGLRVEVNAAATADAKATADFRATNQIFEETSNAPTDAPTETPTLEPTPGISDTQLLRYSGDMYNLIDQATGQRGFNTQLNQYWEEARDTGNTNGCRLAVPVIPEDFVLPEQDAALSPDLASAVVQLNTGLSLSRDGWDFFTNSCINGRTGQDFTTGLIMTTTAQSAFDLALQSLDLINERTP